MQVDEHRQSKSGLPPCPTLESLAAKFPALEMNDAFSWGALIFTTNCRRLLHVYAGEPEIFFTKHIANPNKVPDTVAGIVYPGADNGLDEHHCFARIRRGLLRIPETKVLWTTAARTFEDAAREEISLLREHSCCKELIDYRIAFDSLMSIVFDKEIAYNTPEEYRKLIETKCDRLIATRIALYSRYEADEHPTENPSAAVPEVAAQINAKMDAHLQAIKSLGGKIDITAQTVTTTISGKIDFSRKQIISSISRGTTKETRSPEQRRIIDRVVITYTRKTKIEHKKVHLSTVIKGTWDNLIKTGANLPFDDFRQFDNAVRYDLKYFYDSTTLIARARS